MRLLLAMSCLAAPAAVVLLTGVEQTERQDDAINRALDKARCS